MPTVRIEGKTANQLISLYSLDLDLQRVGEYCKRLVSLLELEEDEANSILIAALWTAALTTYGRCFNRGLRTNLSDRDIKLLGIEGAEEFHRWLMDMRDLHVAHSVSDMELFAAGVVLSHADSEQRRVEGVGAFVATRISDDIDNVKQLHDLTLKLRMGLVARKEVMEARLKAEAEAMDIDTLYGLPSLGVHVSGEPGKPRAGKPRKRPR